MNEPQLLQLRYLDDPWKLLVVCILLNRTQRKQVDGVVEELFDQLPVAEAMAVADERLVAGLLHPLGLQHTRTRTLVKFSSQWISLVHVYGERPPADEVVWCHGVGRYALDAYRMFVDDSFLTMTPPEDKELARWWWWRVHSLVGGGEK